MTSMGFSLGVWNILLHQSAPPESYAPAPPDMTRESTRGVRGGPAGPASSSSEGYRLLWRGQILTWKGRDLLWHPGDNPRMTVVDRPPQHGPPE